MTTPKLDRGVYSPIARALVDGPDYQRLPSDARLVLLTLKVMFGPSGIEVHYPEALAATLTHTTGLSQIPDALTALEAGDWIEREAHVLWIVEHLRFHPNMSALNEKHRTSIQRHVRGLPRLAIVRRFMEHYGAYFPASEGPSQSLYPGEPTEREPIALPMAIEGLSNHAVRSTQDVDVEAKADNYSAAENAPPVQEKHDRETPAELEAKREGLLWKLIRTRLYIPDGKPPADWDESRDGSILRELRRHHSAADIAAAIEGVALLRDKPGLYADAVDWLRPGDKATLRVLFKTHSGVLPLFSLATQAYWKRENSRPKDDGQRRQPEVVGDIALRLAAGGSAR